ncbi:MAG TPA: hypothetical protein DD000_03200 [Cyanobacteria bacterium UBA11166]|nr:hypothetical protein [Cyanobacteria bacterium UBA11166]
MEGNFLKLAAGRFNIYFLFRQRKWNAQELDRDFPQIKGWKLTRPFPGDLINIFKCKATIWETL